jgi:hypothetical protein
VVSLGACEAVDLPKPSPAGSHDPPTSLSHLTTPKDLPEGVLGCEFDQITTHQLVLIVLAEFDLLARPDQAQLANSLEHYSVRPVVAALTRLVNLHNQSWVTFQSTYLTAQFESGSDNLPHPSLDLRTGPPTPHLWTPTCS